jgi:hypothetical protein
MAESIKYDKYEKERSLSAPNVFSYIKAGRQKGEEKVKQPEVATFDDQDGDDFIGQEILILGLEDIAEKPRKRAHSLPLNQDMDDVLKEIKAAQYARQSKLSKLLDNPFFDEVFPRVKQQKPGQDLYVYSVAIGILIIPYVFFFFPRMTGQHSPDLSD